MEASWDHLVRASDSKSIPLSTVDASSCHTRVTGQRLQGWIMVQRPCAHRGGYTDEHEQQELLQRVQKCAMPMQQRSHVIHNATCSAADLWSRRRREARGSRRNSE
jgi:hypothetical protein